MSEVKLKMLTKIYLDVVDVVLMTSTSCHIDSYSGFTYVSLECTRIMEAIMNGVINVVNMA